jgi:hypothetical protein
MGWIEIYEAPLPYPSPITDRPSQPPTSRQLRCTGSLGKAPPTPYRLAAFATSAAQSPKRKSKPALPLASSALATWSVIDALNAAALAGIRRDRP